MWAAMEGRCGSGRGAILPPSFPQLVFLGRRRAATTRLLMEGLNECGLKYRFPICGRASSPFFSLFLGGRLVTIKQQKQQQQLRSPAIIKYRLTGGGALHLHVRMINTTVPDFGDSRAPVVHTISPSKPLTALHHHDYSPPRCPAAWCRQSCQAVPLGRPTFRASRGICVGEQYRAPRLSPVHLPVCSEPPPGGWGSAPARLLVEGPV